MVKKAKTPSQEAKAWERIKKTLSGSSRKLMKVLLQRPMQYFRNVNLQRFIKKKDAAGKRFAKNVPFTVNRKKGTAILAAKGQSRTAQVRSAHKNFQKGTFELKDAVEKAMQAPPGHSVVGEDKGKLRKAMFSSRMIRYFRWGAILGDRLPDYAGIFSEGWKQKFTEKQAWWFLFQMLGQRSRRPGTKQKKSKRPRGLPAIIKVLMAKTRISPPRRILQANDKDQKIARDLFLEGILDIIEQDGSLSAAGARSSLTNQIA